MVSRIVEAMAMIIHAPVTPARRMTWPIIRGSVLRAPVQGA